MPEQGARRRVVEQGWRQFEGVGRLHGSASPVGPGIPPAPLSEHRTDGLDADLALVAPPLNCGRHDAS